MLEAVSLKTLTSGPMFMGGAWLLTRTWWTREHEIGLALLARHQVPIEKAADCLGRAPSSLASRARSARLKLPPDWYEVIRTTSRKSEGRPLNLAYPYIIDVRGEHKDLLAVNALVPHGLPDHMRADVCQEIMLSLWQKEVSLEELRSAPKLVRRFINAAKRINYENSGYALSLDVPMPDGRNWYDVIPDPLTVQ